MMRLLLFAVVFRPFLLTSADNDLKQLAVDVAAAERQLPWFWSPPMEGLADIPYVYQMKDRRKQVDSSGKPVGSAATLHLERIPLQGGSYYRCISQNGSSPCSEAMLEALEKSAKAAPGLSSEETARTAATANDRRRRREAFWADFPDALRFRRVGPARIGFAPTGRYRPQQEPNTELLARIKGEFSYDPLTFEITEMEYAVIADAESTARLYAGSHVSVTLAKVADGHYLPVTSEVARKLPKGRAEYATLELADYRRFGADSSVRF